MKKALEILCLTLVIYSCSTSEPNKEQPAIKNTNKYSVYDTTANVINFYLYPENYEEDFYYTSSVKFKINKDFDTVEFDNYDDSLMSKKLYLDLKEKKIFQKIFISRHIICEGYYELESDFYFSEIDLYDKFGHKTDTVVVTKIIDGYRDGVWSYWDKKGELIKEENWEAGKRKDTKD